MAPQQSPSSLPASSNQSLGVVNTDETVNFVPKPSGGQLTIKRFGEYDLLCKIARGGMSHLQSPAGRALCP